ncbi:hypothetical protein Athai_61880 [Actinocatenispora thailandica]|uniref:GDT1 family protein n=1 Tax=Actinocatenispora thailandica TaxID=227318 RepID=A0A7R7DVM2_9ACTN|nr:hypothetical protein [Actinocatenispora thailandica]BCJ38685.1 hypothetical protein Athai_61880 [Actinocatenispora thailandica]
MTGTALFAAVFLACLVESVEALTIVLAAGTGRDWRSAGIGLAGALVVLAGIVAALGPALLFVPLAALRTAVGGLLLIFGLQWLRKAILRASGDRARHDEAALYQAHLVRLRQTAPRRRLGVPDWYAFTLSFKGVLLEGLEVAFIVLTFGGNQHDVPLAVLAAGCAAVAVAAAGLAVRAPLARVPENTMKFVVGIMLTAFGMFWGGEGVGARWPGGDAALLVLVPGTAAFALTLVALLRRAAARADRAVPATEPGGKPA